MNDKIELKPWEMTELERQRIIFNTKDSDNFDVIIDNELFKAGQKKLAQYLKDNHLLEHRIKNFMIMECEDDCLSCKILKEFGVK